MVYIKSIFIWKMLDLVWVFIQTYMSLYLSQLHFSKVAFKSKGVAMYNFNSLNLSITRSLFSFTFLHFLFRFRSLSWLSVMSKILCSTDEVLIGLSEFSSYLYTWRGFDSAPCCVNFDPLWLHSHLSKSNVGEHLISIFFLLFYILVSSNDVCFLI